MVTSGLVGNGVRTKKSDSTAVCIVCAHVLIIQLNNLLLMCEADVHVHNECNIEIPCSEWLPSVKERERNLKSSSDLVAPYAAVKMYKMCVECIMCK